MLDGLVRDKCVQSNGLFRRGSGIYLTCLSPQPTKRRAPACKSPGPLRGPPSNNTAHPVTGGAERSLLCVLQVSVLAWDSLEPQGAKASRWAKPKRAFDLRGLRSRPRVTLARARRLGLGGAERYPRLPEPPRRGLFAFNQSQRPPPPVTASPRPWDALKPPSRAPARRLCQPQPQAPGSWPR